MKLQIAVTGSSGFIGGHLVEKLVSEGHSIKVHVRKTSDTKHLEKLGVEFVYGDLEDIDSLQKLVRDSEVVYHLSALIYWGNENDYWRVNYQGTRNLLEVCQNLNLERFVYTSSVVVTGNVVNTPATETSPCKPSSAYARSKCEAEKEVRKYHQKFSLPTTIIRPTVVYGPRNLYHLKLYKWIQARKTRIGDMNNWLHLCFIDNLLDGIKLATKKDISVGETYIIGDEKPITWLKYYDSICDCLEVQPSKKKIPLWMIRFYAGFSELMGRTFNYRPSITSYWIDEFTMNFAYDISKAQRELGYIPKVGLEEGIKRTIDWCKTREYLK